MTRLPIAMATLVSVACLAIAGPATAQVTVPAGQDFYATPMATGNAMSMPKAQIVAAAPEPAPAAPAAAPAKHKMMKHKKKM